MPDFLQHGPITTIHELGTVHAEELEARAVEGARDNPIGLVLPVTESDMRAKPFRCLIDELEIWVDYLSQCANTLICGEFAHPTEAVRKFAAVPDQRVD